MTKKSALVSARFGANVARAGVVRDVDIELPAI